jgi:hypothetical protein
VHRPFERSGKRLAELIACHEQPLAVNGARSVELSLLIVG